jgi:glutamyl-tRNA synthetase
MIRTRFAPSPTGYLHIGGVRTALFNWLFARKHGGQFLLRIDDTDAQRNVNEALAPILHGFRWLGIDWDEGPEVGGPYAPYYQSQRMDKYRAAAAKLVEAGFAYYDYATTEEIQAEREAAEQEKRQFTYSRRWMAETPADRQRFEGEGRADVVRLKMPREGKLVIDDLVRERVEFEWAKEQDHVIQRADGTCLYHLASVVDDFDFKISHVIRAEEHLSNTPRQVFIAQGLGYPLPQYAHLPYVAEPGSRNKLSKRKLDKYLKNVDFAKLNEHGKKIADAIGLTTSAETFNPVIVDFYEQIGYLADAIINYLLLLGWSLDDKTEDFTREEMIAAFSLERVNKAPAKQKVAFVLPFLQRAGLVTSPPPCDIGPKLLALVEAAGDRIKAGGDILEYADFIAPAETLSYDEKALDKRIVKPPEAIGLLTKFREVLRTAEPFDAPTLDRALHEFVEREGIQIGQIIHAVRVAVTGKAVGFGLFETLALLGRERCVARVEQTLAKVEG